MLGLLFITLDGNQVIVSNWEQREDRDHQCVEQIPHTSIVLWQPMDA